MKHIIELAWDKHIGGFRPMLDTDKVFDPFYDIAGIFHDVFEHYFEFDGKFKKCTSIWGEMVASAHKIWLKEHLEVNAFRYSIIGTERTYFEDTIKELEDTNYTYDWVDLPSQRPVESEMLENVIKQYKSTMRKILTPNHLKEHKFLQRMADSYRFGYRMAARRYGNTPKHSVISVLNNFLDMWHHFLKNNQISLDNDLVVTKTNGTIHEFEGIRVVTEFTYKICYIRCYAISPNPSGRQRYTLTKIHDWSIEDTISII